MSLFDQGLPEPTSSLNFPVASNSDVILQSMTIQFDGFTAYKAGLPGFPRAFTRDNAITGFLRNDAIMLKNTLEVAAHLQGQKKDPYTGEQPGSIFHEYDIDLKTGVELPNRPGLNTFYNASDTTALFLIGHKEYFDLTGDVSLAQKQQKNIQAAASYIVNHLNDRFLFIEDPKFADAQQYALRVTSWKDSILFGREQGIPSFPVVYPLVHIQNMAGLRAAARLLGSKELLDISIDMGKAVNELFNQEIGNLPLAIDTEGSVNVVSTDGLHVLFYLDPSDIEREKLLAIVESSKVLETPLGYRVMEPKAAEIMENDYHAKTIWTHEQAQINQGVVKHWNSAVKAKDKELARALSRAYKVSSRVYHKFLKLNLKKNPEIFNIKGRKITPGGNDPQLWAIAARNYFERVCHSRVSLH